MYARKLARICVLFVILPLLFTQSITARVLAEYQSYLPAVHRYFSYRESSGILDPTFDGDGIVSTNFGPYAVAGINDLAIQPDGKLVVAGYAEIGDVYNFDFALARYNLDGSLDVSFGDGGTVRTDISIHDSAFAVALQPDGKILAAGRANDDYLEFDVMVIARYNPDGSLDPDFGDGGLVLSDIGSVNSAKDIALQKDGKILVAGNTYIEDVEQDPRVFTLARYNTDGSLDTSFDGDGWLTVNFSHNEDYGEDVTVQPDGYILVSGATQQEDYHYYAMARYSPDGSLDTSFSSDGMLVSYELQCRAVSTDSIALQTDGKIVAACGSEDPEDFILARFHPDGRLDTGFGESGLVRTDWGGMEALTAVALQPNGKIVASGSVTAHGIGHTFVLARYNPDGSLDPSFGYYGQVMTDIVLDDIAYALAIQWDGKIVLAGSFSDYLPVDFALVRYK
jgi:uncharacterized delta-60 repeat protein